MWCGRIISTSYTKYNKFTSEIHAWFFQVNCTCVCITLQWLKENNTIYCNILISKDHLNTMPENNVPEEIWSLTKHCNNTAHLAMETDMSQKIQWNMMVNICLLLLQSLLILLKWSLRFHGWDFWCARHWGSALWCDSHDTHDSAWILWHSDLSINEFWIMSTQNNHTYLIHVVHSAHSNNIGLGDCMIIQSGRHQTIFATSYYMWDIFLFCHHSPFLVNYLTLLSVWFRCIDGSIGISVLVLQWLWCMTDSHL